MAHRKIRHILGLSGGKDSAALAIYMRDRVSEMEYFFCDTKKELPETYAYLHRLEAYLGCCIVHLDNGGRGFDHYLTLRRGFLPSATNRWCTEMLKLKPIERYAGDDQAISYVAIRADEDRQGHLPTKPNLVSVFPFVDAGMTLRDVLGILERTGVGLPDYYRWRSRSGCFFCFFQQKIEWVGLLENHPELFEEACRYEDPDLGQTHTWCDNESLREMARPERVAQIKAEYAARVAREATKQPNGRLCDIMGGSLSTETINEAIRSWHL